MTLPKFVDELRTDLVVGEDVTLQTDGVLREGDIGKHRVVQRIAFNEQCDRLCRVTHWLSDQSSFRLMNHFNGHGFNLFGDLNKRCALR